MRARDIVKALGGKGGLARCPAHDDSTPSLSIRDGERGILVTCHGPCERQEVIAALRERGLWPHAGRRPGTRRLPHPSARPTPPAPRAEAPKVDAQERIERALDLWRAAGSIMGTPGETYLLGRGVDPSNLATDPPGWPETLRWHPDADGRGNGALVVAVNDATNGLVRAVQRIFVDPTGAGATKADGSKRKLALGPIGGNAARLSCWPDPAGRWGLAEGVETALAARYITGIPTWAALSAGNMPKVQPPRWARNVTIFADHDESETGLREAARALHRIRALPQIEKVRVASTEVLGTDVADLLGGIGDG